MHFISYLWVSMLIAISLTAAPPFAVDTDLERTTATCAETCLDTFLSKGGTFCENPSQIVLQPGDAVYPVCSGGFCRSQTLWALLKPYANQFILFPPHAARYGWDPYNGKINRAKNQEIESGPDEFALCFGIEKATRFGFELTSLWEATSDLREMAAYYDQHYYGPDSSFLGQRGQRRVFFTFAQNTHVVLCRLIQTNERLNDVVVVGIGYEDLVSHPPSSLNTQPRSRAAYEHFAQLLTSLLDL